MSQRTSKATLPESILYYKFQLLLVLLLVAGLYGAILQGMVEQWYEDANYSHCFLVPLISGYFLWQRMDKLKRCQASPSNLGLLWIALALSMLIAASLSTEYFTLRSSIIVLIAGMVIYFWGTDVFNVIRLPLLYLFFMVPWPYIVYDALAFPLKLFVTKISVGFLKLAGVVVLREGNIILFPSITLEVADACSGLRSLVSLLALAVAFAFFIDTSSVRRSFLILSAIPIAIFTNGIRVVGTGILAQYWGAQAAEGFFHEFAGLMVFLLAILLLVGFGAMLKRWR